jgi:tripeptidyl-peptidase-2
MPFIPGHIVRKFVSVPTGATWAEITLTAHGYDSKCTFVTQNVALPKFSTYRNSQTHVSVALGGAERTSHTLEMPVFESHSLEMCLAQYWNSLDQGSVTLEVRFRGVTSASNPILLSQNSVTRVDLGSLLAPEAVKPALMLTNAVRTLQPVAYSLTAMTSRDVQPSGSVSYQLMLSYEWEAKANCKVTPGCSLFNHVLYESPLGSQLLMMFDANKSLVHTVDFEPKAVSIKQGKFTLRLQLRHEDLKTLEKLKNTTVEMDVVLAKPVSFDAYPSLTNALSKASKFNERQVIHKGGNVPVFFPQLDSVPEHVLPGDVLWGRANFGNGSLPTRPASVPVFLAVGAANAAPKLQYENIFSQLNIPTEIKSKLDEPELGSNAVPSVSRDHEAALAEANVAPAAAYWDLSIK